MDQALTAVTCVDMVIFLSIAGRQGMPMLFYDALMLRLMMLMLPMMSELPTMTMLILLIKMPMITVFPCMSYL